MIFFAAEGEKIAPKSKTAATNFIFNIFFSFVVFLHNLTRQQQILQPQTKNILIKSRSQFTCFYVHCKNKYISVYVYIFIYTLVNR